LNFSAAAFNVDTDVSVDRPSLQSVVRYFQRRFLRRFVRRLFRRFDVNRLFYADDSLPTVGALIERRHDGFFDLRSI
jgi:hypothetical protein